MNQNALKYSGWILAFMKLVCGLVQLVAPWTLPMHATVEGTYPVLLVSVLEIYSSAFLLYFSCYIKSESMQESKTLPYSALACMFFLILSIYFKFHNDIHF